MDQTISLYGFIFLFPLFLIFIQWTLIGRSLPWIAMLVNLVFILILVLIGFEVSRMPRDCYPLASCHWDGLGLLVVEGYAIIVAIMSTGIGLVIKSEYRKRIWKPGEIIHQTGKIPSLLLMLVITVLLVCSVLLFYRSTYPQHYPVPITLPYKGYP
jgi:hypothetical protein